MSEQKNKHIKRVHYRASKVFCIGVFLIMSAALFYLANYVFFIGHVQVGDISSLAKQGYVSLGTRFETTIEVGDIVVYNNKQVLTAQYVLALENEEYVDEDEVKMVPEGYLLVQSFDEHNSTDKTVQNNNRLIKQDDVVAELFFVHYRGTNNK